MATKNYFMNGITELLVLSLLRDKDRYVYEIVKAIEDMSGGLLEISQNTVYTATYKLVSDGKISEYTETVGKKRTRVYYHLEPDGVDYLEELDFTYHRHTKGVNLLLENLKKNDKK
ncbi:MAG: helix-turn-helix transcriptional regulator [Ruminococcus sp.]|nr:helix-turn-helix transcriptional regulator [Ruminococcus sp.]